MISGNETSRTTDQSTDNYEKIWRQTSTTSWLLDTRRIWTLVLAYVPAIPTTGNGIPPHNHTSASGLAADNHQSNPEGKEPGKGD